MPKLRTTTPQVFQHQADAVLSQANPVSATLYQVLATTKNVRIIGFMTNITWATTQPTPLEVIITVDGQTITFVIANPVSATPYYDFINKNAAADAQSCTTDINEAQRRSFLLEGRSVKVEVRITWATTQPTPLVCRVKYAKIP